MPSYSYRCSCGQTHEEFRSIMDPHPKKCPSCGAKYGDGFEQDYGLFRVTGVVKGDPKTFGQQAELNAKRMGKERMQMMEEADRQRVSQFTGKLPKNAKINTVGTGETPPWRDGSMGTAKLNKPLDLTQVKDTRRYIEKGETT